MRVSRNRLTTIGIAALAGVAVLGWIREPEKHQLPISSERATFQPPLDTIGPPVIRELPGDPVLMERPESRTHRRPSFSEPQNREERPAATLPTPRATVKQRDTTRVGQPSEEEQVRTRAPEPEYREQPSNTGREDDQEAATPRVASAPTVRSKDRSVGRSAAIIAGAAAAGAAIGGLSGGGKGAAIGAITGGAGGYVYDRITRSRLSPARPDTTYRNSSSSSEDNGTSVAQQFGTPSFYGR